MGSNIETPSRPASSPQSLLIHGGLLCDGSGVPPSRADILIDDGTITAVGRNLGTAAAPSRVTMIDADGLIVAPGFIDMHSHADFTMPTFPAATNSLSQGVTSEVVGNCGWSPAPLGPPQSSMREQWCAVASALGPDLDWSWTDFSSFLAKLDDAQPSVNCIPLVGHGAIRSAVFGIDDRPPTPAEMAAMRSLLADAAAAGAWGLSTGLVYPPSSFATADEIHTLARDTAAWGGIYSTHMRNEGPDLIASVTEAIAVARATGVRVQISHLKAAGPKNHHLIHEALTLIDEARGEGLAVGCDVYPYLAGSTVLTQLLPRWAVADGVAALMQRLASSDTRRRIAVEVEHGPTGYLTMSGGWANIMIAGVDNADLRQYEGRFLPDIAAERGQSEVDGLLDIIESDRAQTVMVIFMMETNGVDTALDHPSAVVGSDQLGVSSPDARVHPRAYGTFARVASRASAQNDTAIADLVARCTGRTATRLGLTDRGFIRPGYVADIVAFDPQSIADRSTYEHPTRAATGVEWVWLAGQPAVSRGRVIDASLGRVLRRPRPT